MRTIIATAVFVFILAAFCAPLAAQTAPGIFVFFLEGKGTPAGTIHVYSVNSSSGAITEVAGSPFNAGLIPEQLVVDPTGRFVYITNQQSMDIKAFSVDAITGSLTELSGSPYSIGTPPNTSAPVVSAVDPTGRFFYVFATSRINGQTQELLYEYEIDSVKGVLTAAPASPSTWEIGNGILIDSIAFNPAGSYAYLGQVVGGNLGEPILVCSVDSTMGTLTAIGSVRPAAMAEASQIAVSPSGSLLFSVDSGFDQANAFAISPVSGTLTEIQGSPYGLPNNPFALAVHPAGNFLFVVNKNQFFQSGTSPSHYEGSISAFAIAPGTGGLTQAPGSPFAAGINPSSVVVDPTGKFVYATATAYTSGTRSFAQILGFSINATSGALTPLPWSPSTDSMQFTFGNQLAISFAPSTTINPVPAISSLSPPSTTASDTAFTLGVNGTNFVAGSTVYFGGQARGTAFVSSTQLNASILAGDINNDGTAVVNVFNPLPGGGASTSVEFPVSALPPVISSLNPPSASAGGRPFALFVTGSNFVASSVVNFNGVPQATTYLSPSLITMEITTSEIATAGTATITVTTPSNGVPGGGTSNAAKFTITPAAPLPVITSISPTSATAGGPGFTLTVNGSGFVPGSQANFNLNDVATTFLSSTQLTAAIPASAIAVAGNPYVIVTNPDGFVSPTVTLPVNNPQPGGISVFPPSLPAGSNALTLNVTGTGFVKGCVVQVNGDARATTYESSTMLQATLHASDLSQGRTLNITVVNPPPGGGTAANVSFPVSDFTVTAPNSTPAITAGQTATFALTVSSIDGTFSNPVAFAVSPSTRMPAGTTATITPSASITPGAAPQIVTLSITTTARGAASKLNLPRGSTPVLRLVYMAGAVFSLAVIWLSGFGDRGQRLAIQIVLAILIVAVVSLAACGAMGSGPSPSPQGIPSAGTPAGTYPIIVTATSGGISHSANINLTVM